MSLPNNICQVNSSHGDINCDKITGEIVGFDWLCGCEECEKSPLTNIVKVDLDECRKWYADQGRSCENHQYFDILDVGYWYKVDGGELVYEPPTAAHRAHVIEMMTKGEI